MRFGVIALPDAETSARIVRYSQAIGALSPGILSLGEAAPPHLSLVHAECSPQAAREWWGEVERAQPRRVEVDANGVVFARLPEGDLYVPQGGVSVAIDVVRGPGLDRLHRDVLALATTRGLEVLGRVGDDFRPHITLNVLGGFPVGEVDLPDALLAGRLTLALALGRVGEYGTFPEIVDRSDDPL